MDLKPIASLSLDLDNKWSYLRTHGDPSWASYPSYLDLVVPRILKFLHDRSLTITFFIVGQDAARPENQAALRAIAEAGHEVGNHSFMHQPWLHLYSEQQIEADLVRAEEQIDALTGVRPIGFRGPGYGLSEPTLRILARRGYEYDASTLPSFIGPLARLYYFMSSRLSAEERHERSKLFGTLRDGVRPLRPYWWSMAEQEHLLRLAEIPVTTMPIFRMPIHISYVLYLSTISPALGQAYFELALSLCRLTRTPFSLLLHPLDFLGGDDVAELSFFPAMSLPSRLKLQVLDHALGLFCDRFSVVPVREFAHIMMATPGRAVVEPHFQV